MDIVRDSPTFRPTSDSLRCRLYACSLQIYIYIYIYQGVSNYWNREFESNSNHANKRICAFFCVPAVLWISCKELISYTKSRNVACNEEKQEKNERRRGGGGGGRVGVSLSHKGTQCYADT